MIANTLNEKWDLDITLRDIEWMHRIGEHNQLEEKPVLLLYNSANTLIKIEYLEIRRSQRDQTYQLPKALRK